jgi:diacylglycerol O-acyltransferase / wax synthase
VMKSIRARKSDPDYVSVFQAPKTIFNQRVSGARRFAAQSFSLARIKAAGKKHDATLNDAVLAMCASAVRRYLLDLDALPKKPLIAMVPVSLRKDDSESGNQVALVLANLGTHIADPMERLDTIVRSVQNSKERFARMSQGEIMAYLGVVMAAHGVNMVLGINPGWQAFNLVISNVPGPKDVRYYNGARVDGLYPVSIVIDGSALNITLNSYAKNLEFGVIGCRRTLPHLQKLLQYLEDGLAELEGTE